MGKYNNNETESNGINIIDIGTQIKGNINSNSDIRIDGNLTGNITTAGKLVIGKSGIIAGEINCKNADISGKVEGKIISTELLSLKSTAIILGDIIVNRLAVEPGCVFSGNCKMDADAMTISINDTDSFEKSKAI
jgi:cytoskeletal protein CcmA (bactofilin family)